jgi:hypothetical protein
MMLFNNCRHAASVDSSASKNLVYSVSHSHRIKFCYEQAELASTDAKIQDDMRRDVCDTGAGMIIIVVVCLGFLTFMIVLGILRVRSSQQQKREGDDKTEMEWDNSALTITINPMEQEVGQGHIACSLTLHVIKL